MCQPMVGSEEASAEWDRCEEEGKTLPVGPSTALGTQACSVCILLCAVGDNGDSLG